MIEYLSHAPSREVFVGVMTSLGNPVTGEPLAALDGERVIPSEGLLIDEIGPVHEIDQETGAIVASVERWHVNLAATGQLEALLADSGGWLAILPMLGAMAWTPAVDGAAEGFCGASGMVIYPAGTVTSRVRAWMI